MGATSNFFVMVMFRLMPIAVIFLHSFYIVASYLGKNIVPWPHLCRPFAEIRDRVKGKIYFFRDYNVFWDKKSTEPGQIQSEDLFLEIAMFFEKLSKLGQIQSCKFFLSLFDRVWFRSKDVLIKCHFDQVSF